jgi:DNA polymerase-3 subunit gamma/tau
MPSYLVLARKYRPRTFEEVIGQEAVTRVLRGAIEEKRIGHAYLFSGPRGTGKTTLARILAKCLNCEEGPTVSPCGACPRCVAADEGTEVDVIEIDAASHTGVDGIRELRDEVAYAPMRARTKVYIVDEVHMLSKQAFNALLKTLEEPPPHVVFLFATTEPHKVLDTVLSRCQVLRLSALPEERIAERLTEVFRLEGVEPGEGVIETLARGARGGMRDALSLADKLLALAGDRPTLEDLERLGGETGAQRIETLLDRIEAGDRAGTLELVAGAHGDENELAAGLLDALRTALVLFHCGVQAPFVAGGEEERARAVERAGRIGADRLELWLEELLRARERMRLLPDQAGLVLESALLALARPESTIPLAELVERVEALSAGTPAPPVAPRSAPPASSKPTPPARAAAPQAPGPTAAEPATTPATTPAATPPATPAAPAPSDPASTWRAVVAELRATHGALAELLEAKSRPTDIRVAGSDVTVPLADLSSDEERLARDRRNQASCSRAWSKLAGGSFSVRLAHPSTDASPVAPPSETAQPEAGRSAPDMPAAPTKDAFTEEVADLFGGVIEDMK